jgi:hypothetical protein
MNDKLKKLRDDLTVSGVEWANLQTTFPQAGRVVHELVDYRDRIDALLAESGAGGETPAVYALHGAGLGVTPDCELISAEDVPGFKRECVTPLYTTPQPSTSTKIQGDFEVPEDALRAVRKWLNEPGCGGDVTQDIAKLCSFCAMIAAAQGK